VRIGINNLKRIWDEIVSPAKEPAGDKAVAQAALQAPVVWLIGKVQSGKSSIVEALTASTAAEVGNGFKACTRFSRVYDFPEEAPSVRFLDTRGLGEVNYDPSEDLAVAETHAHLLLVVMRALDAEQESVLSVAREVRQRHPEWPMLVAETSLHDGYPHGQGHLLPYPFDSAGLPTAELPNDLARALSWQRRLFDGVPGTGAIEFVPIDFTRSGDGFEPRTYGLDAMREALLRVAPAAIATALAAPGMGRDARSTRARGHILGYAAAAAAADVVPVAGVVAVPGLQAKMLHSLGAIYGVEWDRRTFGEFTAALGTGVVVRTLTTFGVRELAKLVPIYGQTAGAAAAAAMSFTTTYALGVAAVSFLGHKQRGEDVNTGVVEAYRQGLREAFRLRVSSEAGGSHGEQGKP
jgi:uncharacterized protein (DUF697 family)